MVIESGTGIKDWPWLGLNLRRGEGRGGRAGWAGACGTGGGWWGLWSCMQVTSMTAAFFRWEVGMDVWSAVVLCCVLRLHRLSCMYVCEWG